MQRILTNMPVPGGERAIRHYVASIQGGKPDYGQLEGEAADELHDQPWRQNAIAGAGPILSVKFLGVEAEGALDVYLVSTEKYLSQWSIALSPAGKLRIIRWRVLERPPATPPSVRNFIDEVRTRATSMADKGDFSGAILIQRTGKPLYTAAFGMADRDTNIPNTVDTRFRIGSMGKMFTAVAVLQLAERGRIRLDAPISTYLPNYENSELAEKVTIHHLLTHTGATGDIFGPDFVAHRSKLRTLKDYVDLYGARGIWHRRLGTRYSYSNYGFVLLGRIVEVVSGENYYDYVSRHIFNPAGMRSTGLLPETVAVPKRAIAYTHGGGADRWRRADDTLPYRGTSAGGGYSTVGDIARFADALLTHRLLSRRYTDLMMTGRVFIGDGNYGYGIMEGEQYGVHWVGHSGGAPGMCGELRFAPERGFTIVTLANIDAPSCMQINEFAAAHLPN